MDAIAVSSSMPAIQARQFGSELIEGLVAGESMRLATRSHEVSNRLGYSKSQYAYAIISVPIIIRPCPRGYYR